MKYFLMISFFLIGHISLLKADTNLSSRRIKKITFVADKDVLLNLDEGSIGIKEGDYIKDENVTREIANLKQYLYNRGYLKTNIDYKKIVLGDSIEVVITISIKKMAKVVSLKIVSDNVHLMKSYEEKIRDIENGPFGNLRAKIILDNIAKEIFDSGYYHSKISFNKNIVEDGAKVMKIALDIQMQFGFQYNFYFRGNEMLSRFDLIELLRQGILANKNDEIQKVIESSIAEEYKKRGIFGTHVNIRSERAVSINNNASMMNFFVVMEEGQKIRLQNFSVEGNSVFTLEKIEELYYKNATPLAAEGYFDNGYLTNFIVLLKKEYLARGFVLAEVSGPDIDIDQEKGEASVVYSVSEQKQCILKAININGVDGELADKIRAGMSNKENKALNVLEIENDIIKAMDIVRREGYFFAKIKKSEEENIVSYNSKGVSAKINIDFDLSRKGLYQAVVVKGNTYTEYHVIEREVDLKKNKIITLEEIEEIREKINGLGLFSQIKITPIVVNRDGPSHEPYKIDLLIEVEEKKFGNAEFSLGYRTDIGIRLSAVVSHNNLWRKQHSFSTKGQVNQRLDYNSLDFRRRREKKNRLEGLWEANYNWPYFIDAIDFDAKIGFERKRFFAFDADILKLAPQVSKNFSSSFSVSLGYQLERISQFDATKDKDKDSFSIGSLTPSLTLDYRDDPIRPRQGSFFRLSWEFANPSFSFNKDDEKNKIDFSKLVSRNKFYFSYGNWALASSLAFGAQWNRATQLVRNEDGSPRTIGYIPSIKVFRLDGIDAVRGFSHEEINRLYSGEDIKDISEERVNDRACFSNIKLEPRYYWDDSLAMGLFLDAGGISVDDCKLLKLRYATGISLKILTLVGTLDFDYGIKLRRRFASGAREKFGRFHLSIGHF